MTANDDSVLKFLEDHSLALPPRTIEYNLSTHHNVDVSYSTLSRRLKYLIDAGLVEEEYEEE